MAKTVILIEDINNFVTAIIYELRLWRNDMDYQAVRKKIYALYEMRGDFDNAPHSLRHVRSQ